MEKTLSLYQLKYQQLINIMLPSLWRVFTFEPHIKSHAHSKSVVYRFNILVQANDKLTCPVKFQQINLYGKLETIVRPM